MPLQQNTLVSYRDPVCLRDPALFELHHASLNKNDAENSKQLTLLQVIIDTDINDWKRHSSR